MPAPLPTATLFGRRLRAARLAAGMSQVDLGAALNEDPNLVSPRISRYERGDREPDHATVKALADTLGVPEAYFFAASDTLAEVILLVAKLPPDQQKLALRQLKISWPAWKPSPRPKPEDP